MVLTPLVKIISKYMDSTGIKHDADMEYRKLASAAGLRPDLSSQLMPMVAAARRVFEDEFLMSVTISVLTSAPWGIIAHGLRTRKLRAMAFMMLSQIGCLNHELRTLRSGCPFKMFKLLDGECAAEIERDCELMKDGWSKALVE
eukprot:3499521-Pyramimonas_sp.AAC.1